MTDMTPEEINQRIAAWAGLDSHVCDEWSFHCDDCERGSIQTPDYYHANAAMDLLGVLVDKKYWYEMSSHADDTHTVAIGEWTGITSEDGNLMWIRKYICEAERKPTIPAAICHAIMEIIEREGE